jgi:hypothetical protein
MLFGSVMRAARNVVDLPNTDYTFLNDRLTRHYGIPNVYWSQFRRVAITDGARRGLPVRAAFSL